MKASPAGPVTIAEIASVGSVVLARGVIRAMMRNKLKDLAILTLTVALAPVVIDFVTSKTSRGTSPDKTPGADATAIQERPTAGSVSRPPEKIEGKLAVAGAIVDQDGTPARDARVFYSLWDHAYSQGEVRVEAKGDAQGRFAMQIPTVEATQPGLGAGMLWAYRRGSRIAAIPVYRGALPPGLEQRLILGPPARASFEVRRPDGTPAVAARILPHSLNGYSIGIPDALGAIIGADTVTDLNGRAVMTAFFPEEITSVRVIDERHGQQDFEFGFQEITPEPRVITLRPVGRLKGRLVGDPDAIRRRPLRVVSFNPPGDPVSRIYLQDIMTDEQGHFEVPASAVGPHVVKTVPRYNFPWYSHSELLSVEPGRTTEVVLELKRAIRVHGIVRETDTEAPIPGVRVTVALAETGAMTTGPDGRYEGYIPPDGTLLLPRGVPSSHAMPRYVSVPFQVPKDAVDFEVPPLNLMRAGEVRGLVVDDDARRVAGAEVEAVWDLAEGRPGTSHHQLMVRTGPDGRFVFDRVPEKAEVELSSHHRGLRTRMPRVAHVGEALILRLTLSNRVALEGIVRDIAGRPVAGAHVHLRSSRRNTPQGRIIGSDPVEFEGGAILVTDAEGRFRTPEELDPDGEYAAYASAVGFQYTRTIWMRGRVGKITDLAMRPESEPTP